MTIESLELKEFRGIKEMEKPIEFSKFNVLIGRNNCGKSSIIEALALLPYPHSQYFDKERIDYLTELRRTDYKSFIYRYTGTSYTICKFSNIKIKFEITDNNVRLHLNKKIVKSLLYSKKYLEEFIRREEGESEEIGIRPILRERYLRERYLRKVLAEKSRKKEKEEIRSLVEKYLKKKNVKIDMERTLANELITPNNLHDIENNISLYFDNIVNKEIHTKILKEVINPAIDEEFTEIINIEDGLRVRKEIDGMPIYIKINDLGLGVEKILAALLWLGLKEPKIVLWDDFESNIHPTLLQKVLEWLASKDWQVIMSTHSIDVLYRLAEIKPKDAKIIMLRKKDDILVHKYLSMDGLEDLIDSHQDPRIIVDLIKL